MDATIINRAISYLRKRMDLLVVLSDGYGELTPEQIAIADAIQLLVRLPQYNFS